MPTKDLSFPHNPCSPKKNNIGKHGFEIIDDFPDTEIISTEECQQVLKISQIQNCKNLAYYVFILLESVVMGNAISALIAIGYCITEARKICGSEDMFNILPIIMKIALFLYQKGRFLGRLIGIRFGAHRSHTMFIEFTKNLESMLSYLGFEIWGTHIHVASVTYEGLKALTDFTDHRKILYWFLRNLRDELIKKNIWPKL